MRSGKKKDDDILEAITGSGGDEILGPEYKPQFTEGEMTYHNEEAFQFCVLVGETYICSIAHDGFNPSKEQAQTNAQELVKRWNIFPALLEACEAINVSLIANSRELTANQRKSWGKVQRAIEQSAGQQRLLDNVEQAKEMHKGMENKDIKAAIAKAEGRVEG